jgi:hypothetical protein
MPLPINLPQTANIVGWWRLEENGGNATDSSGNNNTLTETSGTVPAVAGKIANGRDFEAGDTEYLEITDASQTGLDITGEITLAAWVKLESNGIDQIAFGKYKRMSGKRAYAMQVYTDNKVYFTLSANGTAYTQAISTSTLNTAIWYHIAATLNQATDLMQVYINGSANGSAVSYTADIINNDTSFTIGCDFDTSGNPARYFDGVIDEVIIWNKCLTATEVDQVYDITSYQYNIAAAVTPAATIGSAARVGKRVSADVATNSVIGSLAKVNRKLASEIAPTAVVGSAVRTTKPIASAVTSTSTIGSLARLNKRSYSDVISLATVSSTSRVQRIIQSAINAAAIVGSFIRVNLSFAGEVIANSVVTSAVKVQRNIQSAIQSNSTVAGRLVSTMRVVADIVANSQITSALTQIKPALSIASNVIANSIVSAGLRANYSLRSAIISVANVGALLSLFTGGVTTGTFYLNNNTLITKTGADVGTYHILNNATDIRVGGTYIPILPFHYPYFESCTDGIVTLNLQIAA